MRRSARIKAVSAAITEAFRRQRKTLGTGARKPGRKPGQQVLVAFDFSCWFCHA
jgi:hypothetical protein